MATYFTDETSSGHVPETESPAHKEEGRRQSEQALLELRRKVQDGELLSKSIERLLLKLRFNGRLTIVVQNGRILKSGYEEGYFHHKENDRSWT